MVQYLTSQCLAIGLHCAAAITLALFAAQSWSCDTFWYVFGFCR